MLNDIKKITLAMNENIRYLCRYWKLEILELKMLILETENPLHRLKRNTDKRVSKFENIIRMHPIWRNNIPYNILINLKGKKSNFIVEKMADTTSTKW